MPEIKPDFTYLNAPKQRLECGRCGATQPYKLPMPCDGFAKIMIEFARKHQECRPPQPAPPLNEMTECKIINPSDECFMAGDDREALCAAGVFLGRCAYGLKSTKDGSEVLPIFITGGWNEWWLKTFGHKFEDYTDTKPHEKIAKVLDTFRYARERGSINDIGKFAKHCAEGLRRRAKEVFDATV